MSNIENKADIVTKVNMSIKEKFSLFDKIQTMTKFGSEPKKKKRITFKKIKMPFHILKNTKFFVKKK